MLHGDASLAKACGADGVHLSAGSDPTASRAMLGPAKLIGVSLHTVTEAEAIDPNVVDYAIAGPTFETPSKPGYGPEIGRKGGGGAGSQCPRAAKSGSGRSACGHGRCLRARIQEEGGARDGEAMTATNSPRANLVRSTSTSGPSGGRAGGLMSADIVAKVPNCLVIISPP